MNLTDDQFADLRDRIRNAVETLDRERNKAAASHALSEHSRLAGKIEGVKLVVSYIDEYLRERS